MNEPRQKLSLWQVLCSVLAAAFGVQSERARARDFRHGTPGQFIVVGLIVTTVLVLVLIGAVNLVIRLAGAS